MASSYHELLSAYSAYMRRAGQVETAAAALRMRSRSVRDVIAYVATYDKYTFQGLVDCLNAGSLAGCQFRHSWLATLGRVCALQAFQGNDIEAYEKDISLGLEFLRVANRSLSHDREHQHFHRLEAELLARQGHVKAAASLVANDELLKELYYGYMLTDLDNPVMSGSSSTYTNWLEGFNRPFVKNDLQPLLPTTSSTPSFNRLQTGPSVPEVGDPKVSVIMTSYQPKLEEFLLAAKSILNQTWQNLELIIVDDASPARFDDVLARAQGLDDRVRVIKLSKNGGTYRARNAGLASATGGFITGQDSDDWSHPERLARQVNFLASNPSSPGVVVEAIRMNDDLVRMFPGRKPERLCEVSLMLRNELAHEVGGYLDARKAADSEFRRRIEGFCGRQVYKIEKPLYLTRIGHESLSGADFKPGWSHPVRRAFWNVTQHWHENAPVSEFRLPDACTSPVPVPSRFKIDSPAYGPRLDAVFIGDWRAYGGMQRVMMDEIAALLDDGQRVGVMHFESLLSPSKETTRLCAEVQSLINRGDVHEVIPDENASATIAIIHDPTILQFSPLNEINLVTQKTLIIPHVPPSLGVTQEVLYLPLDCDRIASALFSGVVIWTATDPSIKRRLVDYGSGLNIHPRDHPVAFQRQRLKNYRPKLTHHVPIVGRHAENHEALWPANFSTASRLWPADDSVEVRILGDARALLRKYGQRRYPLSWINFRDNEISPEAFMSSIDFFVYYPEEGYSQSFSSEALEAAAAGALVILPEQFEEMHGPTAIYVSATDVPEVIREYTEDTLKYREASHAALLKIEDVYSNARYVDYIQRIAAETIFAKGASLVNHAYS